jgi:hypothetical protein
MLDKKARGPIISADDGPREGDLLGGKIDFQANKLPAKNQGRHRIFGERRPAIQQVDAARKQAQTRRRMRPEDAIQKAVFEHIKQRGVPGLVALHPANGGLRSRVEASRFKAMGVIPGAPDVLLWHADKSYALELKSPDGRVSEAQAEMLARLGSAGVYTCVAHGLDRALKVLEAWGLLWGASS